MVTESKYETVARIAYMYGYLEGRDAFDRTLFIQFNDDLDEVQKLWEKIADDWHNYVDIKDISEEAFVCSYASRKLLEQFGKKLNV